MVFQDVIGGEDKKYDDEWRCGVLERGFAIGMDKIKSMLGFNDEDCEEFNLWLKSQSLDILALFRKTMTDDELDKHLRLADTESGRKMQLAQIEMQEIMSTRIQTFLMSMEDRKNRERKDKMKKSRMDRNMNDEWDSKE